MNRIISLVFICCSLVCQAQKLSKPISVHFQNQNLEQALNELERDHSFQFSYGSSIIDLHKTAVTYTAVNKSLNDVLIDIIPIKIKTTELGSYIIIQDLKKNNKEKYSYQGRIIDKKSKNAISDASVYVINDQDAAISASNGDYKLNFQNDNRTIHLAVSKLHYRDTIIKIEGDYVGTVDIELEHIPVDLVDYSEADHLRFVQLMAGTEAIEHMKNVNVYQKRFAQFSFLPMLGTNGKLSGKTTNHLSINLLGGYSYSLKGLELGAFANIERQDVDGVQMAGFANIAGHETHGVQMAGFVNLNKRKILGLQMAGFTNIAIDTLKGVQLSGFTNIGPYTTGLQMSGFVNTTWAGSKAEQISGFMNYSKSNTGSQIAGFTNFTLKQHAGVQASGFLNYAGSTKGVQLAGFANLSIRETKGFQAAGFLNVAGTLKGVQLGLINYTDTVASGVSLGLLNFSRRGLFEPEFFISDLTSANVRLKTGTEHFYNVLGFSYFPNGNLIAYGYGLGSRYSYPSGLVRGFEIQGNLVLPESDYAFERIDVLSSLNPFIGFKFHKHLGIFAGPVLNVYASDFYSNSSEQYGYDLVQSPFYESIEGNFGIRMNLGYRLGLSF